MTPQLLVDQPGLHTTVQDFGRTGHQAFGVPVAGALDPEALRGANRLVGNPDGTAALEILHAGPAITVAADSVRIALAGTETTIDVAGQNDAWVSVPAWQSIRLSHGQRVRIGRLVDTACAVLAIEGGLDLPAWLGSRSTYVRAGMGGFRGRALVAGDRLPLFRSSSTDRQELRAARRPDIAPGTPVRVVLGPQDDYFTAAAIDTLLSAAYKVSAQSDRMGLRLEGPPLAHLDGADIASDGIVTGAIQVPGAGLPILLLNDHQTSGGYPKIATVISADLPRLGRHRVGEMLRFAAVSVAEAEDLRRARDVALTEVLDSITPAANAGWLDPAALHSENLISGVVDYSRPDDTDL